jgi:Uma2 family endonuclease
MDLGTEVHWEWMERRPATYADLEALPEHLVGELIDGVLYTSSRPAFPHAQAASVLGMELGGPFHRGRGGPGGWRIIYEPGLRLGEDVLVPDLAGWRRERLPQPPRKGPLTVAPDWVCEVLSPSTEAHDRAMKLPLYAQAGVRHVWLVDPGVQTLEVFRLEGSRYTLLATHVGDARVRAEPFEALELELGALWEDAPPG